MMAFASRVTVGVALIKSENINMLEMPKKVYDVVDIGLIKIY